MRGGNLGVDRYAGLIGKKTRQRALSLRVERIRAEREREERERVEALRRKSEMLERERDERPYDASWLFVHEPVVEEGGGSSSGAMKGIVEEGS